jgi:8-oxo-dGTP diphosphatase
MPFTRIEVVVMTILNGELSVLLAKRMEDPYAGEWALPGGVLRIDLDGSLESAASRVVHERLGTKLLNLEQLCAVGGPKRDPRSPWALSVVYRALLPSHEIDANAGKRIEALEWRNAVNSASNKTLAFDHADLIGQAVERTKSQVNSLEFPAGLLQNHFTLGELQTLSEQVLGHPIDKSSFRRKLSDRDLVELVDGEFRRGPFRPAQLYRLKGAV